MQGIIPVSGVAGTTRSDVTVLVSVLARTHPDVWEPVLPDELPEDTAARLAAAGDFLDELLGEFPAVEAVAA